MQDVQIALRNVDTAKQAFLNSDSTNDDVLRERYEAWRESHKALSDTISNAESGETEVTDVTDTPQEDSPVEAPTENPSTLPGTDLPAPTQEGHS